MSANNLRMQLEKMAREQNRHGLIAQHIITNLATMHELSETDFCNRFTIALPDWNEFLAQLNLQKYEDLMLALMPAQTTNCFLNSNPTSSLNLFYNQIHNSLALNYELSQQQMNVLDEIIGKLQNANHLYLYANKNDEKIVEDFANNLISYGFKTSVFCDLTKIMQKNEKIHDKDVFLYIFDDYKNRALADIALRFQKLQQQIIISKSQHHHLANIESCQYGMDYSYFRHVPMINTRKIILMLTFAIISQKITTQIVNQYQAIREKFQDY